MKTKFWILVLFAVTTTVALFSTTGGFQNQDIIAINMDDKVDISQIQQIDDDANGYTGEDVLRVAIAGVLSPTKTLEYYRELLTYMEQELGRQVTLIQKPSYAEINDLIRGQRADLAFICSLAYVLGHDDFGLELLAVPQMYGAAVYYSYLIVSADSSATSLEDLEGGRFVFTDPLSNSGYLVPSYQLSLLNETPASFYDTYYFTYSHDNSVRAVADGLVEAAAIDSLIYDRMIIDNPELALKTKVIARWGPYGIPPVVVNPALDDQLKQQLLDFLLNLHESDRGKAILSSLDIDKFIVVSDSAYDSIRGMKTVME